MVWQTHQMDGLTVVATEVRGLAEEVNFSGVVRIEQHGEIVDQFARDYARRADNLPNRLDTRFAVASATKGLTALTIASLIESGELTLDTSVSELVGDLLPLVDGRVTIAHMLSHTSGVGDYLDEEVLGDSDDHILEVSAHTLEKPSDYLPFVARYPQVFSPGERFAYNNGAFVMLSIIIERITGSFHDAVAERVLGPAGITGGGFFRSDELPANTALGYLKNGRTNVFHIPVVGAGDGGIYLTLNDVSSMWRAFFDGGIVSAAMAEKITAPVHMGDNGEGYGLGFWLRHNGDSVALIGADAGVSFRTLVRRSTGVSYTVISNTSASAWPLVKHLEQAI